jgi:flavin-dependent dehydrogenase
MGGLAACIFLRQRQLRVVCIEPQPFPHAYVGESLDWSSPGLLASLGLSRDALIAEGVATYKRNIKVRALDIPEVHGQPTEWLAAPPRNFELTTMHVDRVELDQRLFAIAQELGVTFVWDHVSAVETSGDRVVACSTASNQRFTAPWFIDGSGQAQLFGKAFKIAKATYGRRKVCLWTYLDTPIRNEGTTFYGDNADEYLTWIWEIPTRPDQLSIGCIMEAERLKERRKSGTSLDAILREECAKYPQLAPLFADQPELPVRTCAYQTYVYRKTCGPNWLIVGEAASLPDPLTANGVTAAFRHGQEAAKYIAESRGRGELSAYQRYVYNTNLRRMGRVFNHSIERSVYEWPIRQGLSVLRMERVYTTFSYPINALYTKFRPHSRRSMVAFGLLYAFVYLWMETWALAGRLAYYSRRLRQRQPARVGQANT